MKPRLQTSLGQHLVLTPQLRQALALLQMSALELEQEMALAVESNPLLDWAEPDPDTPNHDPDPGSAPPDTTLSDPRPATAEPAHAPADEVEFPDLSPWESGTPGSRLSQSSDAPLDDISQRIAASVGLHEHLAWQLRLSHLSPREQLIGEALIDAIDDDGYLREPISAIQAALHPDIIAQDADISTVLHRIQCFDPVGVGARDLSECLSLQLVALPPDTPARALAQRLVTELLERLPRLGAVGIAAALGCAQADADAALALLRSLDPHPGAQIGGIPTAHYLTPDCTITHVDGVWRVALADHPRTRLRIHHGYEQMLAHTSGEDSHYLRQHLQQARGLLQNIEARGNTLLKVVGCIVHEQAAFLQHGPAALRPLTLRDVAQQVGLHESTVSRAVAHKYALTPRGTMALKDFFASGIDRDHGEATSSTAISQMLRELIASEPAHKPLSDAKLTKTLNAQGIPVARRTVTKYREALNIPASHERVRLG